MKIVTIEKMAQNFQAVGSLMILLVISHNRHVKICCSGVKHDLNATQATGFNRRAKRGLNNECI